jgi:hypothetical protein
LALIHHDDRRSFVAMVGLMRIASRPRLAPIRSILAQNPRVVGNPALWSYVAYKGGSEPGGYAFVQVPSTDGRVFVFSFVLNDARHEINQLAAMATAIDAMELLSEVH